MPWITDTAPGQPDDSERRARHDDSVASAEKGH